MTTFPHSPQLLKGGLIFLDPENGTVQRIIALQYNPETLSRTLQAQAVGSEGGDRSQALRLKGPPIETIKLDASIDAVDQLEFPDSHPITATLGVRPQLAALELLIYPASSQLQANHGLAQLGTLEIIPMAAPLVLLSFGQHYLVPVRITEFSIVEEAFDPQLNPIMAKVSLGFRVLSINDLPFGSKGGSLFMAYQRHKEELAGHHPSATLQTLGIGGIP